MDDATRKKWDKAALSHDLMAAYGTEKRWLREKTRFFSAMDGKILFLALGTGLDIAAFPEGKDISAIDISPVMIEKAQARLAQYSGSIDARVMDVHQLDFPDGHFDQVFTSCTFCSVPNPIEALLSLKRVLKPGGTLHMFEHTGSKMPPFSLMLKLMTLSSRAFGPEMDRPTVSNVQKAGFNEIKVKNLYLDILKIITAKKPV